MIAKRTILLLEDDANLGFILAEHLEMNGFTVRHCTNGVDGLAAFRRSKFNLCLVDVMMPKKDGFTFVKELRQTDQQIPVIFLTAKSLKEDRIEGLRIGADDYITKPFSMEELMLRIAAVLKRSMPIPESPKPAAEYKLGTIVFNTRTSRLTFQDKRSVALTTKEAELLAILCLHRNAVVNRDVILTSVWNSDSHFAARSMDVYVSKLRKHLKKDPAVSVVNIHGKGYKLIVDA